MFHKRKASKEPESSGVSRLRIKKNSISKKGKDENKEYQAYNALKKKSIKKGSSKTKRPPIPEEGLDQKGLFERIKNQYLEKLKLEETQKYMKRQPSHGGGMFNKEIL